MRSVVKKIFIAFSCSCVLLACSVDASDPSTEHPVDDEVAPAYVPGAYGGGGYTRGCTAPDPCTPIYSAGFYGWGAASHAACGSRVDACGFTIYCNGGCELWQRCESGHDAAHPTYLYCW
jgi:hypothetical protein